MLKLEPEFLVLLRLAAAMAIVVFCSDFFKTRTDRRWVNIANIRFVPTQPCAN